MPPSVAMIRDYSYYRKGSSAKPSESDIYIKAVKGQKTTGMAEYIYIYIFPASGPPK
jgi:hypothetical protein